MRYIFVFLLCFLPILVDAREDEEKELCKNLLQEQCEKVLERYWWGDKFDEVDSQVQQLQNDMRAAILNNDYSLVEKYISFPFRFFVEDGRDNETLLRRDNKNYSWIAYNIKEFGYWFRRFLETKSGQSDFESENNYLSIYYGIGVVTSIKAHHKLYIKLKCGSFTPTKKKEFYVLPRDLHLCQNTEAQIENIAFDLY